MALGVDGWGLLMITSMNCSFSEYKKRVTQQICLNVRNGSHCRYVQPCSWLQISSKLTSFCFTIVRILTRVFHVCFNVVRTVYDLFSFKLNNLQDKVICIKWTQCFHFESTGFKLRIIPKVWFISGMIESFSFPCFNKPIVPIKNTAKFMSPLNPRFKSDRWEILTWKLSFRWCLIGEC